MRLRLTVMAVPAILILSTAAFAQEGGSALRDSAIGQFDPNDFSSLDAYPAGQLIDVPVETASGARVGTARQIGLGANGSAARVRVDLYTGGYIWIVADALRYNRNARVLLTNLRHIEATRDPASF